MMSLKLAILLLSILLWVLSIDAGTFVMDTLLPRPNTGDAGKHFDKFAHRYKKFNGEPKPIKLHISPEDLNRSLSFGTGVIDRLHRLETNLDWSDIRVKQGTPSHGQLIESAPETQALIQGKHALIASKATIHLMNAHCLRFRLAPIDCAKHIQNYKMTNTLLHTSCSNFKKVCSLEKLFSKYRSLDGSCNHVISEGNLGQSFTGYKRLLHPDYLDGIQEPRRSVHKKHSLPSARKISTEIVQSRNVIDKEHTLALMQWTQFVAHDLAHTVTSKMVHSGKTIECCSSYGTNLSPRYIHPFCAPISVPNNDEFYAAYNMKCMSYVRSVQALRSDCSFGPIEQLNQATHFLDASQVYGSDEMKALSLRSLKGGQLKSSSYKEHTFLPISKNPTEHCQVKSDFSSCFLSGDSRVNMQPHLTVMHTLWLREHNRVAEQLEEINPQWDDETLYQEARRIVIAEIQHITYNEWLPELIGNKYVSWIKEGSYSDEVNPSVSNSFATAAIRFVKSLAVSKLGLYTKERKVNATLSLSEHFNKPMVIENDGYLDALVRGLATQHSQKLDLEYVRDLSSQLYGNGGFGFDILSLDLQRGRDHGLPGYTAYRSLCGLPDLETFEDFLDAMPKQAVKSLAHAYKSPHDVDLLVGGLAENPDGDSLLGPTFSCLVSDQFTRTRHGDRYFYTHGEQPVPFTRNQLNEIKKVSLARIFCDNSDDVQVMQPNVFKTISSRNNLVYCNSTSIPFLDPTQWWESR